MAETRERVTTFRVEEDRLAIERARAVLQYQEQVSVLQEARQSLLDAQVRLIEAESDVRGLRDKNSEVMRMLDEEKDIVAKLTQDVRRLKAESDRALATAKEMLPDDVGKQREINTAATDKSLEDIDGDIGAEQARLQLVHAVPPNIVREFEQRAKDIQKLGKQMEAQGENLEEINNRIKKIRDKWEPELDDLVAHINDAFSANFAKIGCAGEVSVHKEEDFAKWAIDIKVKFR